MSYTLAVAKRNPGPPSDPNGIKKRMSIPDGELIQDPFGPPGQEISRTLRKVCAQCGDSYYSWQVFGQEKPPGIEDPDPPIDQFGNVGGMRGTCGSPDCHEDEVRHQIRRSKKYHDAIAKLAGGNTAEEPEAEQKPRPKLDRIDSTKLSFGAKS